MIHRSTLALLLAVLLLGAAPAMARDAAHTEPVEALSGRCTGTRLPTAELAGEELGAALAGFEPTPGVPMEFTWQLTPVKTRRGVVFDLTFPSPRPCDIPENNTVWCRFYRAVPDADDEQRRPVALVLHHLGGDFALEAALATYLASQGIHALEVEFPYYGKRKPEGSDPRGEIMKRDVDSWIAPMQQVVADVRRATDWLLDRDDVDPERIGVVGVSLGGIIGALTCGVDTRLERNVLVISGGDLATIVSTPSNETSDLRRNMEERGLTHGDLVGLLRPIEPLRFAQRIEGRGLLMINAELDQVVVRSCTDALIQAVGDPTVRWLETDHYGVVLHLPDIFTLVRDHLREATPAPGGADDDFF